MVERFFSASLDFVQRGLLPSGGIIEKSYLWETWEDTPYTPRAGYPVEIELLWLTVLRDFLPTIRERDQELAGRLESTLEEGNETFRLFYLDGYLADSLGYDWQPQKILTPNGYIAFALRYPLPADLCESMVQLGREQLAGRVGIRSLAPRDWQHVLSPEFMSDSRNFQGPNMASVGIYNYHRGIEWPWLNQFFVAGELLYGDAEHAFDTYLKGQVHEALHEGGAGGISELYDIRGPLGADYQAWSMASFIAGLHSFGGVEVDALDREVRIRPALPRDWRDFEVRRRVADTFFDVHVRGESTGHIVEVDTVGKAPEGYRLRVGARVPPSRGGCAVRLNGKELPGERVTIERTSEHVAEAWIETDFEDHVEVTFSPAHV
jgi:glycogen debranching enzyme